MGIGARVFFVEDDNRLKRISFKRWENLVRNGEEAKPFPEYAGQKVRCALVVLKVENRKPVEITALECTYLHFGDEGCLDQAQRHREEQCAVDVLDTMFAPEPPKEGVIDARQRFLEKQIAAQRWEPTREIVLAIKEIIFMNKLSVQKALRPPLRLV